MRVDGEIWPCGVGGGQNHCKFDPPDASTEHLGARYPMERFHLMPTRPWELGVGALGAATSWQRGALALVRVCLGVRVILSCLLSHRQDWGRGIRLLRSTLEQCADRISLVRFAGRDADEDTFLGVECACRVDELAQRARQIWDLASAIIAGAHDDTEDCGLAPGFRCHRLDPIVCLFSGGRTR